MRRTELLERITSEASQNFSELFLLQNHSTPWFRWDGRRRVLRGRAAGRDPGRRQDAGKERNQSGAWEEWQQVNLRAGCVVWIILHCSNSDSIIFRRMGCGLVSDVSDKWDGGGAGLQTEEQAQGVAHGQHQEQGAVWGECMLSGETGARARVQRRVTSLLTSYRCCHSSHRVHLPVHSW